MPSTHPIPCPNEESLERNRYFAGQLLTEADLTAEQDYHLAKQRAHNRYLHGYGTVCGLAVESSRPASATVVVQPGLAIDCCGREIFVVEPITVDPSKWLGKHAPVARAYVTLTYGEVEVGPTPALDCSSHDSLEVGRVREIPQVGLSIGPPTDPAKEAAAEDVHPCPPCPDSRLILAVIELSSPDHIANSEINNSVRRMVDMHSIEPMARQLERLRRRVARLQAALLASAGLGLGVWMTGRRQQHRRPWQW